MSKKVRLDVLLLERGLVDDHSQAKRLIMAGQVRVGDQRIFKPDTHVPLTAEVALERSPRFVSRGGEKLKAAFECFDLHVKDKVCADVGASTGGFTDCLLQHGAATVYAIDVGKGILHWKLRQDPRVVVMEETNARHLDALSEPVGFVTIDASFISLKLLLPAVSGWMDSRSLAPDHPQGQVVALIKPQFEAGRREAARRQGVIRDPAIHQRVLREVLSFSQEQGFGLRGLIRSPLKGPKGNSEFLAWLGWPRGSESACLDELLASESLKTAYK